jgi:hypothetical protein
MNAPVTMERLPALRRLTRALEASVQEYVHGHVAALAPLLRPRAILGDFVQGPGKDGPSRSPDKLWKEVVALYDRIAPTAPFKVSRDLHPPVDIPGTVLELTPVEYTHVTAGKERKSISVRKPFDWIVSYSGNGPAHLRDLVAEKNRDAAELQRTILVTIVLHVVVKQLPAVARIFADLRIPLETHPLAEFGELPVTVLSPAIPSIRPDDAVLIDSTEMTGTSTFQEVVDVAALAQLPDPLRARVAQVLQAHGETLPAGA